MMAKRSILIAGIVLLALTGCVSAPAAPAEPAASPSAGSTPDSTASTSDSTSDPAPAETIEPSTAPVTVVDPADYATTFGTSGVDFDSPSRNLRCGILAQGGPLLWGCSVLEHSWTSPDASPGDYCFEAMVRCGEGVEAISDEAPHPRKRSDVAFAGELGLGDVRTLPYGSSLTYNDVTCASADTGMTCTHATSGHGFTVSESVYSTW